LFSQTKEKRKNLQQKKAYTILARNAEDGPLPLVLRKDNTTKAWAVKPFTHLGLIQPNAS
jgi:hypothetical protein